MNRFSETLWLVMLPSDGDRIYRVLRRTDGEIWVQYQFVGSPEQIPWTTVSPRFVHLWNAKVCQAWQVLKRTTSHPAPESVAEPFPRVCATDGPRDTDSGC